MKKLNFKRRTNKLDIKKFGWNDFFEQNFEQYRSKGLYAGRIYIEQRSIYGIYTEFGEMHGEVSGKMRFGADGYGQFPAVGDWVAITPYLNEKKAVIHAVIKRKSQFVRKVAGNMTQEQVAAANFDTVFIVNSLNQNFNVRRIERYLIAAWESGANPAIILSKADLCQNIDEKVHETELSAPGVPVYVISSLEGTGMEDIKRHVSYGKTAVVLGSSGVGKSTLINALSGKEILEVGDVREDDDRGRHTTTFRELIELPAGGFIIDTPGMRELQLWDGSEGISETFEDIEILAQKCRFSDCRHENEPGCAVKAAITQGILSEQRFKNYKKLQREIKYAEGKQRQIAMITEKRKMKNNSKHR